MGTGSSTHLKLCDNLTLAPADLRLKWFCILNTMVTRAVCPVPHVSEGYSYNCLINFLQASVSIVEYFKL